MKKYILLIAFAVTATFAAMAQSGGNFQRRTPEERLKPIHEKIDSAFKLEAAKLKQVDEVFLESFKEQDKKMEEIRASGTMDREAMMAARQELMDARDKKLKAILTEEQMKIFKDKIEPSLRPQRGGGRN